MSVCSFNRLLQLVDKQLDLDGQLEIYGHLDRCDICRDSVYQLSRDRDDALFIYRAHPAGPYNVRRTHHMKTQQDLRALYASDRRRSGKHCGAL